MAYLTSELLLALGFKRIGFGVKISDKASIYNCDEIEIGDYSRIDDFCIISGKVKIGKYCHITPMCLIAGGATGVTLSDFSTIAYGVKIFAQSDDYSGASLTNSLIPRKYKKETFGEVSLGKHVIIGANSTVLPGVAIAEGCSVGAMSLVNKSTDPWGVYFGIPAKRIKDRMRNILDLEKEFLSEMLDDPI